MSGRAEDRRKPCHGIAVAAALMAALAGIGPAPAGAQATSNPNLNAQLLVAAREADVVRVERALAQGAAPDSRND